MRFLSTAVLLTLFATLAFSQEAAKKITTHEALGMALSKVQPDYPPVARQLKIQGVVEVEAVIGESGAVEHVKGVSGSPVLTKAASEAMQKWKFKPFTEDGKPIKVTATFSFTFAL